MSSPTSSPAPAVTPVEWLEWGPIAFDRSREEGKPVLLSISATWCHGCGVMDRVSYADPAVASLIASSFIPVRVDADRRPDINDRYNLDGWPTTACLTSSGEILTGTTYLPADGLKAMLAEVSEAYASQRATLDDRARQAAAARRAHRRTRPAGVEPDLSAQAWIASQVIAQCDPDNGGFGSDGKFLHVAALSAALAEYSQTRDAVLARALALTLDGMADGAIHDQIDGGFFRHAASRDWTRPHTEKMLDDQIGLAVVYLDAARMLEQPRWREVALSVIGYVRRTLADEAVLAFFASQAADEAYYQVHTAALRRTLNPPAVDRTAFTNLTAQAAAAWMQAGAALGDVALSEAGARALDRILTLTYRPGEGVAHWFDGHVGVRGLLVDQVHASRALLMLHEATGNPTWSMLAEEVMRTAIRTQWDEATGCFLDRVPNSADAVGLLADPLSPLAANCVAAQVLARLSRLVGDRTLQDRALDVLRAFTATYRQQGLFGAPYALAVGEVLGVTRS
jgi:uncharacterized protein